MQKYALSSPCCFDVVIYKAFSATTYLTHKGLICFINMCAQCKQAVSNRGFFLFLVMFF